MVHENKFEGKNDSSGRFQAMNISEEVLCMRENMWKDGPCPHQDDPAYVTFEEVMTAKIAAMTRPVIMAAMWTMPEYTHLGKFFMCM